MQQKDKRRVRPTIAAGLLFLLSACSDGDGTVATPVAVAKPVTGTGFTGNPTVPTPVTPAVTESMPTTSPQPLGLVEVTITGIGGQTTTASAKSLSPGSDQAATGVTPKSAAVATLVSTGIDMAPLNQQSFDVGTSSTGGTRYVYATFKVRNAQACSTPGSCSPYTVARKNLTLVPAVSDRTIAMSPFSAIANADGSSADPALATQLKPTHGMAYDGTTLSVQPGLESLQFYSENEVAVFPLLKEVRTLLPYSFVVRSSASTTSRALPANPASGQFDGLVTIAFKLPLSASQGENPYTVSLLFEVIDDANTRVSESVEEATLTTGAGALARAQMLGANDLVSLGLGGLLDIDNGNPICTVRLAGTAASPSAYVINGTQNATTVQAAPNFLMLQPTDPLRIAFCQRLGKPDPTTLAVSGSLSGPRTLGTAGTPTASWTGGGTNQLIVTPTSGQPFFPGETVSYSLNNRQRDYSGKYIARSCAGSYVVGGLMASDGQLVSSQTQNVGATPSSVAAGDFNGDGIIDLAVGNTSSDGSTSSVAILLGTSATRTTFAAPVSYATGSQPYSVVMGDFNGDGIPDLATANVSVSTISVLLGSSSSRGTFAPKVDYATGSVPVSIVTGDFNGDGIADLATANRSGSVSVLLGSTTARGAFLAKVDYPTGSSTSSVVMGDFDGDGILDLAATNTSSNNVSVLLGSDTTRGTFGTHVDYATGQQPQSVAAGDLNGDGIADLVVANQLDNTVSVLLGQVSARGTFAAKVDYALGGSAPVYAALGDLNGDGVLDVAVANSSGGNSVSVLLGSAKTRGTFTSPASQYSTGFTSLAVVFADFTGDHNLDILSADGNANSVTILESPPSAEPAS